MAHTTIPELTTLDPLSGEIENGPGFFFEDQTFFYWADIAKVLTQSPKAPIENLRKVNVLFQLDDGAHNHERHEVTGLALRKTEEEIAALNGNFNNAVLGQSKWHNIVALAWPVYYKEGSTQTFVDSENEKTDYNGMLFSGSSQYNPGQKLSRTRRNE